MSTKDNILNFTHYRIERHPKFKGLVGEKIDVVLEPCYCEIKLLLQDGSEVLAHIDDLTPVK